MQRWAVEAAQYGTFTAALADEQAASNIGGLPVPALCIGTRRDLLVGLNPSVLPVLVHHEETVHDGKVHCSSLAAGLPALCSNIKKQAADALAPVKRYVPFVYYEKFLVGQI